MLTWWRALLSGGGVLHGQCALLWERGRGGQPRAWEAALLGGHEPGWVQREETCPHLPSRSAADTGSAAGVQARAASAQGWFCGHGVC